MRPTSPSRRSAALLAASTIGLSTAVLGVTGVASAELAPVSFSTSGVGSVTGYEVLDGYCTIDWTVVGGAGGAASDDPATPGAFGGLIEVTTEVAAGQVFTLAPGGAGRDATASAPGAGGTNSEDSNGTAGSSADPVFGGGGGASSDVVLTGTTPELFLTAFGGDGALRDGTAGRGAGGDLNSYPGEADVDSRATVGGEGVISGVAQPCVTEAPIGGTPVDETPVDAPEEVSAPEVYELWATSSTAELQFYPWTAEGAPEVTGWEYTLDGGTSWQPLTITWAEGGIRAAVVEGLAVQTDYSLKIRAISAAVVDPESEAVTFRTLVDAPTAVKATVGTSSIRLDWAPPAAGTGVEGYVAWALPGTDPQSSQGLVECPELDAAARSCSLVVPAGTEYSVFVAAYDSEIGDAAGVVSASVPAPSAPATVPTVTKPFVTDKTAVGTPAAGDKVTLKGAGFAPGSTVSLFIYSTPTPLGQVTAGDDGTFTATVTIPAGFSGNHSLVAAGIDPSGAPLYLRMDITIAGAASAAGAVATGGLAYTGFTALPFVGGGLLALLAGGGLLVAGRRRRA